MAISFIGLKLLQDETAVGLSKQWTKMIGRTVLKPNSK